MFEPEVVNYELPGEPQLVLIDNSKSPTLISAWVRRSRERQLGWGRIGFFIENDSDEILGFDGATLDRSQAPRREAENMENQDHDGKRCQRRERHGDVEYPR